MAEIDYGRLRKAMVEFQLKGRGIHDPAVLDAFGMVCRHNFVPDEFRDRAYEDNPLPIGFDQTISQPYIVAFMIEKLGHRKQMRALEIGTGSGYQTALLSCLFSEVYSVEISAELAKRARETLSHEGFQNAKVKVANGYNGYRKYAPFDRIIVSCAPVEIPQALIEQLAEGGRMVIPAGAKYSQKLYVLEKVNGTIYRQETLAVRFVPMLFND